MNEQIIIINEYKKEEEKRYENASASYCVCKVRTLSYAVADERNQFSMSTCWRFVRLY